MWRGFFLTCFLLSIAPAAESGFDRGPATAAQRFAELIELARRNETSDLARAWEYAEQARAAAQNDRERLEADLRRLSIQRRRGDYDAALLGVRAGLERAEALRDDALRAEFLQLTGLTEWSISNFPASLESYKRAAALAESIGNVALAARAHSGLASTYRDLEDFELARRHYETALAHAEKLPGSLVLADILNNLGNYYTDTGEHQRSLALHRRALALREAAGNTGGMADSYFNLGTASANDGDLETAVAYYARAQPLYETIGFNRNLANLHYHFAGVLRKLGRTDEGLVHLRAADTLAEKLNTSLLFTNIYREYTATHAARGDYRAAFEYQQRFIAANERVRGEKTRQQVAALNVRYETERRQHEIALLRRDQELKDAALERARTQRYGLLMLLGLSAVAVGAMVSRHRLKLATERRVHDEMRAAKDAAERADAFKTRLVGIASHDLKAPVAALIAGAEALGHEAEDPESVRQLSQLMASEGERLLVLIRDLLDMAALETGRLDIKRVPVAIASVVRASTLAFQPRAREKGQELTCTVEPAISTANVSGDPERLRQVIDNLVDNAVKFTPRGRPVRIMVTAVPRGVCVAVHDSGPGLSAEDLTRVFQPFQKLSARPTAGESSTGLGLSIAKELIALHGGQMAVDSTPGEGARFRFELPVASGIEPASGSFRPESP